MEPERWHRVEQLYHSALKIATEQRSAFLKDECQNDEELRQEVESLLSYESSAAEFIESPAFEVAARLMAKERTTGQTAHITCAAGNENMLHTDKYDYKIKTDLAIKFFWFHCILLYFH